MVFFFLSPSFILYIRRLYSPPPPALQFYLSKKSDRWSDARSSRSKKQAVSLRQSFILSSSGSVSSLGGGEVFLIVPDINELRLVRGFTDLQVFRDELQDSTRYFTYTLVTF